jgi:hypothetical protein
MIPLYGEYTFMQPTNAIIANSDQPQDEPPKQQGRPVPRRPGLCSRRAATPIPMDAAQQQADDAAVAIAVT